MGFNLNRNAKQKQTDEKIETLVQTVIVQQQQINKLIHQNIALLGVVDQHNKSLEVVERIFKNFASDFEVTPEDYEAMVAAEEARSALLSKIRTSNEQESDHE